MPLKFQRDTIIITSNLAAVRPSITNLSHKVRNLRCWRERESLETHGEARDSRRYDSAHFPVNRANYFVTFVKMGI